MKTRYLTISTTFALLLLAGFLIYFNSAYQKERELRSAKIFLDYQMRQLYKNIEDQKFSSLAIARLISQNDGIAECFLRQNRSECANRVSNIIALINFVSMYKNIKIHLHTADFRSLLRSWDFDRYNDDLSTFRFLLKETNMPNMAGIENGISGTYIRAISSVEKKNVKLGTVEVMLDFDHISAFFREQGVDLYVLVDKDITQDESKTDALLENYKILNYASTNLNVVEILKDIELDKVNFYKNKEHYFAITPLIDIGLNRLGYYVLHINRDLKEQSLVYENFFPNSLF